MTSAQPAKLLDDLQHLLEKQLILARQGSVSGVRALSKKSDSLVRKITEEKSLESVEYRGRRQQLRKLYTDLCLALKAQKDETGLALSRVRSGKKAVAAYRNSI